jgi:glucose/arabinose dehydrogenase
MKMTELNRRSLFKAGLLAAGATSLPVAASAPASAVPHAPTVLAKGLVIPWSLTFLPDGNALTGERDTLKVFRINKTGGRTLVGTVGGGARRLFALALSPNYATDNLLYAHVRTATDARLIRMTYTAAAGLGTPRVIFSGIPLGNDHHGGGIVFSPDKQFLFTSVGDKGTPELARVNTSLAGKILRLRLDGTVPTDNPFGTTNPAWAKGIRNVEGMSFDPAGRLWAVEFGEDATDELDQIVRGGDYGWPDFEGGDGAGPVRDPFVTWSPTSTCSPAGVAVKNGYAYVGALQGQCIFRVKLTKPNLKETLPFFQGTFRRIRAVAVAPDGSIWFTTANNDPAFPHIAADDRVVRFLP